MQLKSLIDLSTSLIYKVKMMAIERTFSIVKPDAVGANLIGAIYSRIEASGLKVIAAKMLQLDRQQAEGFMRSIRAKHFLNP